MLTDFKNKLSENKLKLEHPTKIPKQNMTHEIVK